jgi:hypothetical protein
MGEPALRIIAHELVQDIRKNITVDWCLVPAFSGANLF